MDAPAALSEHAGSFGAQADAYDRARPSYPDEALDWLLPPSATRVLDLGAGTGKLTARLHARGLEVVAVDPSAAMLERLSAALPDVQTHQAGAEAIPLPDASVDVIISNCVINLSPDKGAVLREAARVLRPGGRFAVSDIVAQGASIPPALRADMAEWASCASGALEESEYRAMLCAAGFDEPEVVVTDESACGAG